MELKTKVQAEEGRQDLTITREFDIPKELLFKAYTEAEFVEQWMNTKVITLESKRHGRYEFETSDPHGNLMFRAAGVIHEFIPNEKITRTFEMDNSGFNAQLEFLVFEAISDSKSKLSIHTVFKSNDVRDSLLKMPFAFGISMAHDQLEHIIQNKFL